ncbi:PREDICTED: beta-1,3-galactosyltransferase 2-like [Nanorana parkeri]|uniref:beta-1,3-galactosyltransferase 2-like n=1 Tax=Nanorana parkeri TaxID=125878 RepID=UPI0008542424|nr:PREDICTED: beta-1,3-galactosyltransferase 2-like [Nanorana parkeri]
MDLNCGVWEGIWMGSPPKKALFLILIFLILISYSFYTSKKLKAFTTVKNIPAKEVPPNPMYPYLIEEDQKCASGPPFLLLLIPSIPQENLNRDTLRKTWANETLVNGVNTTRLFLLGRSSSQEIQEKVMLESSNFHDIIQQDFIDSYNNLTLKTLMGIEWVSRLCPNVSYVMKIDSDMFLNPWFLMDKVLLPSSPVNVNFYTGLVVDSASPQRDKSSKWYMPLSQYSKDVYPSYCSGTSYIFSGDLAGRIYKKAHDINIFPFEDVFVGMCLQSIGIQISKPAGNWFLGEKMKYDRCQFASLVTVHHFTPQELLELWPDFTSPLETCNKQGA